MRAGACAALLTAALLGVPASAAAQVSGEVNVRLDPARAGKASRLSLEAGGSAVSAGQQAPRVVSLFITRGFRLDPRARATTCSEEERRRLVCPAASRIGAGAADGEATYLLQRFAFRVTFDVFLAEKAQRGDVAGIAVVAREEQSGRSGSGRGRVLRSGDPAFGYELRFDSLATSQAPPGATVDLRRLALEIGAHRTVRRKRTVRRRGTRRRVVRKRRYDLIRNPRTCVGSWPYRVRATFHDSEAVRDGSVACSA